MIGSLSHSSTDSINSHLSKGFRRVLVHLPVLENRALGVSARSPCKAGFSPFGHDPSCKVRAVSNPPKQNRGVVLGDSTGRNCLGFCFGWDENSLGLCEGRFHPIRSRNLRAELEKREYIGGWHRQRSGEGPRLRRDLRGAGGSGKDSRMALNVSVSFSISCLTASCSPRAWSRKIFRCLRWSSCRNTNTSNSARSRIKAA